jgi:hypothetical protein
VICQGEELSEDWGDLKGEIGFLCVHRASYFDGKSFGNSGLGMETGGRHPHPIVFVK